jgi:hypothetical protein
MNPRCAGPGERSNATPHIERPDFVVKNKGVPYANPYSCRAVDGIVDVTYGKEGE